ncbi:MAG: tRNA 2-selenouridine(34) synthase MnmH [Gammaproteobacteria bacterium]|nr:tRNA 2-selenouridine(34) synthase MnmH [Gammaproteobacteria bacterium]MDP2139196.1 tRNA 2-selenouridine(34) synthase MnmH [Gammaproteobacteria bacterium]MDP2349035.1 tRNA 2-selenouridine(34) synthase MnmH [Gammaproteobacteria bacterium]
MTSSSLIRNSDDTSLLHSLFLNDVPLLDVRAPEEFTKGAFPLAINIPLLENDERRRVGTIYKHAGQAAAIELGHHLVAGTVKDARMARWQEWCSVNPQGWLYCFRGGLRSQITQEWLSSVGTQCPRVPGGYKAMRQFLIETIENVCAERSGTTKQFVVIAGRTGSGKTQLLQQIDNGVDLEKLAGHRGSAFGTQVAGQPAQINFENELAIRFLKLGTENRPVLFIEDESKAIGSLSVPHRLYEVMKQSPVALIQESLESRTDTILNDYICDNLHDFEERDPANAFTDFSEWLQMSLSRIQRRLGGEHYQEVLADMQEALRVQKLSGETAAHGVWISKLLTCYYDPMYAYQLARRQPVITFEGCREEFLAWTQVPATA